jgi:hypothetical protein
MRVMNTLKPCSYCGHTSFDYFPNVAMDFGFMSSLLGLRARQGSGKWWMLTIVACKQCGNTLIFTTNAQELCQHVPGAQVVQAAGG